MVLTKDTYLPSEDELRTEEITMSSPALRAGASHFGKYCDIESKEFMLCRGEEHDPRKCLKEGKAVTECGLEFYRLLKGNCYDSFERQWRCIEVASPHQEVWRCRKTQAKFDKCMVEKLGIERPPIGYFSSVRIHDTTRPRPKKIPIRQYEEIPRCPDDYQTPDPNKRGGTRFSMFR